VDVDRFIDLTVPVSFIKL